MYLKFLVHPGLKKRLWTPELWICVLVCPVNSIHYHNDLVVCSAGETRSGNGDGRCRQEWRKCHGKHSCCHILLWSHRGARRDLSLVHKKAEEERKKDGGKERKKAHPEDAWGVRNSGTDERWFKAFGDFKEAEEGGRECRFVLGTAYTHLCVHKCLREDIS